MAKKSFLNLLLCSFTTVLLASCGGGGDSGDGTYPLAASPNNLTLSSSACGYASGPFVTVYGGVAPYYLKNPYPKSIGLSKEKVNDSGDNFKIDFLGGCFTTLPILIIDSDGNTIEVQVTYTRSTS
jgi:hypothetical protein